MGRLASRHLGPAWIVVVAGLLIGACAGPLLHTPARTDREMNTLPSGDVVLMIGVVVDTIGTAGTLVVKDVQDHGTWTVAIGPGTRFYGIEGGMINVTEIEIGQRVQIRGTSRVPSILEADEIDVEKTPSPPTESPLPGLLPR